MHGQGVADETESTPQLPSSQTASGRRLRRNPEGGKSPQHVQMLARLRNPPLKSGWTCCVAPLGHTTEKRTQPKAPAVSQHSSGLDSSTYCVISVESILQGRTKKGSVLSVRRSAALQVAARHPNRAHLLHAQVIHSKLASGRWPRLGTSTCLPNRLRRALESWGFETDRREIDGTRKDEHSIGEAGVATKMNPIQTETKKITWYWLNFK